MLKENKNNRYQFDKEIWGRELINSKLGAMAMLGTKKGLARLEFCTLDVLRSKIPFDQNTPPPDIGDLLTKAQQQVEEYLSGIRKRFDLPIDWCVMTPFMKTVLKIVYSIPFGKIMTYGEIAKMVSKPGAARAVGMANARNPIPLIIPCHRVVGSDKRLHGFSAPGGLQTKAWLLTLEGNKIVDQKLA